MADKSKIEWTDATWNPITGCSVVSPGCTNCYAMKLAGGRLSHIPSRAGLTRETKAGPVWTGEVRLNERDLDLPLRWKRPRMIFVCAHGDLFHESVPDAWIDRVFTVIEGAPQHTFQVLTKRAERMRQYLSRFKVMPNKTWVTRDAVADSDGPGFDANFWPLPNVWLGISAEDQIRFDERAPHLAATPAAVRWVSAEPLLGPIHMGEYVFNRAAAIREAVNGPAMLNREQADAVVAYPFDWIVVGGESQRGARPMHPDWARSIRDQCKAAGVAFHFKQWGDFLPYGQYNGQFNPETVASEWIDPLTKAQLQVYRVGKRFAGRRLDGVTHDEFPR